MMFLKNKPEDTVLNISSQILGDVNKARKNGSNDLDGTMNFVGKLPRCILEIVFWVVRKLEYFGIMPEALMKGDPNYSSCKISNLGLIKAVSCYHHLSDYGTLSIMIKIGTIVEKIKKSYLLQ